MLEPAHTCQPSGKIRVLRFSRPGTSCGSHRHHRDHWTRFIEGGPFWVCVYHHGIDCQRGELQAKYGPFNPGDSFFVHRDYHHEVLADGPGVAHCEFVDDGTKEYADER